MKDNLLNEKTLKHELPPNWKTILEHFPSLQGMEQKVVFTYYPHIYMPRQIALPPDIAIHEHVHLHQQAVLSPGLWWKAYLSNPEFRLNQELEAYGAQLHWFTRFRNLIYKQEKHRLASDLSSEFYGNIISYGEAASRLQKIVNELGPLDKVIDQDEERRKTKREAERRGS